MKNFSPTLFLLLALPLLLTGCFDEKSEISEKSNMEKHRGEERGNGKHAQKETPTASPTQSETPEATPSATSTEQTSPESAPKTSSKAVSYPSPGGQDDIVISVTLENGKIVSVSGEDTKVHPESAQYNKRFYSAISAKVSGKTLEEAQNIGIVAGASLTSKAFTNALSQM